MDRGRDLSVMNAHNYVEFALGTYLRIATQACTPFANSYIAVLWNRRAGYGIPPDPAVYAQQPSAYNVIGNVFVAMQGPIWGDPMVRRLCQALYYYWILGALGTVKTIPGSPP